MSARGPASGISPGAAYGSAKCWLPEGFAETAAAALDDADHALEDARGGGHAGTLMYAQLHVSFTNILCAKYAAANAQSSEVIRLAEAKL